MDQARIDEIKTKLADPKFRLEIAKKQLAVMVAEEERRAQIAADTNKLPWHLIPFGPADGSRSWDEYFERQRNIKKLRELIENLEKQIAQQ